MIRTEDITANGPCYNHITAKHEPPLHIALAYPGFPSICYSNPWLEVCCGAALIFRRLYLGAITTAMLMMATFMVVLTSAQLRGLNIACGCFGAASPSASKELIIGIALLGCLGFLLVRGVRTAHGGGEIPSR
jgi:hypothetical protein